MFSISRRSLGVAAVLAFVALPTLLSAQRRRGAERPDLGMNSVAPLIDMRRQLDLSSRQVATLDSIERSLLQKNRSLTGRLQARRDSLWGNRDPRDLTREDKEALRGRLDSLAPLRREIMRNDSTARAAALRVLTDSQRVRVRELQAERRGFAMGRMTERHGMGGRQGMGSRMGPRFGPRGRFGAGGIGPGGRFGERRLDRPMRPDGPRGEMGPRFRLRRPGLGPEIGPDDVPEEFRARPPRRPPGGESP
jgi:hypothetical protein